MAWGSAQRVDHPAEQLHVCLRVDLDVHSSAREREREPASFLGLSDDLDEGCASSALRPTQTRSPPGQRARIQLASTGELADRQAGSLVFIDDFGPMLRCGCRYGNLDGVPSPGPLTLGRCRGRVDTSHGTGGTHGDGAEA